jgi:superoxide dismutase, Fe-Mn family
MLRITASICVLALSACATAPITAPDAQVYAEPGPAIVYSLPDLPYAYDALEGAIDAATMEIHHSRHHAGYVRKLNAALAERTDLAALPLDQILANISALPPAIRNNAGGHYNHELFWRLMAPAGTGGEPSAALLSRIEADFGSMDAFKAAFSSAAASQFGSGWAWLILSEEGLEVTATPNQDNPLMDVAPLQGTPILAVDVWEHAYYLRYQNKRGDYLAAWWTVVNWNEVNRLFEAASGRTASDGSRLDESTSSSAIFSEAQ